MRAPTLLLMLGAAACATARGGAGTVTMMSNVDFRSPPVTYAVGPDHVSSSSLDAKLDAQGCVRGTMAGEPLDLCETKPEADGTQHWAGTSGEVSIKPVEAGKAFEVQGFIYVNGQRQFDVTQTLRPKADASWDALRARPVLLFVATTATDLHALRNHHGRPL
jgi:hypothetical protein